MFGPQLKLSSTKDNKNHTHNNCTALYKQYITDSGTNFFEPARRFWISEMI
jgi:hypothetical protein